MRSLAESWRAIEGVLLGPHPLDAGRLLGLVRRLGPAAAARGLAASLGTARAVAEREFSLGEGIALRITCSVGIACYPFLPNQPGTVAWTQVVELADHALYLAKSRGRNTWVGLFATAAARHDDVKRILANPETISGAPQLRLASPVAAASTAA